MISKTNLKAVGASSIAALALTLVAAVPASAQSYHSGPDPLAGAILRGVLSAVVGQGQDYGYDQGYYRSSDCRYYRDGYCYRNVGHWEREHGINSRSDPYGYDDRYGNDWERGREIDRDYGRNDYGAQYGAGYGLQDGRTYAGQGYYRDGRFWRNHGQWRSYQNLRQQAYRYDRRW